MPEHRIRKIALTGGIACGKSLAGDYLRQRDVPVLDADDVVHRLLKEDEELKTQIRQTFGDDVFDPDGTVNRPRLGGKVFQDVALRKLLESWIHPKVRQAFMAFYEVNAQQPAGVAIIPLLFESDLAGLYEEVWLLDTPEALQMERLLQQRGMSESDAAARIRNQMRGEEKRERTRQHPGGVIIENTGSPEQLYTQLDALLEWTSSQS